MKKSLNKGLEDSTVAHCLNCWAELGELMVRLARSSVYFKCNDKLRLESKSSQLSSCVSDDKIVKHMAIISTD